MTSDKNSADKIPKPENTAPASPRERRELIEKIQNLEWSLAQKRRENKSLQDQIEEYKQENADLTAENNDLRGNRNSDDGNVG